MEIVIKINDLVYSYPDGVQALKGISFDIHQGESVAILGPNGSGKTTFLLHLNGILQGKNGAVKVLGMEMKQLNLKEIRRRVGLVFQDPDDQLFMPTVFDDVAFGTINLGYPEAEVRQRVKNALEQVGMSGYEARSPHHLSFGERKRIAIATVLSMSPEILVFDEPTSNLDPRGKWALIGLLKKMALTRIIASHDLELVKELCSRAIILDHGKVVADGSTSRILADTELLKAHGLAPVETT